MNIRELKNIETKISEKELVEIHKTHDFDGLKEYITYEVVAHATEAALYDEEDAEKLLALLEESELDNMANELMSLYDSWGESASEELYEEAIYNAICNKVEW